MAHVAIEPRTGIYQLRFRWDGRNISRSLKTKSEKEANDALARVDETIALIQRGRLVVPEGADIIEFIVSDGTRTKPLKETHKLPITFGALVETYEKAVEGSKEKTTFTGEKIHLKHLKRLIGERTAVTKIDAACLQDYVDARLKQKWNGKPIQPATVKKELRTLQTVWRWAEDHKHVKAALSLRGVQIAKTESKPPFRTWEEIEKIVAGVTDQDEKDTLWSCLFLTMEQIRELMVFVKENAKHTFIEPMFAMAAYTGARRSEIARSLLEDWDFNRGIVSIREKKRVRDKSLSFREVPIHPHLKEIMERWLTVRPAGRHMILEPAQLDRRRTASDPVPLTIDSATHHFLKVLEASKWEVVKGFHTLRHSFASNLASRGIAQHIIDAWMGHQTAEMAARYRHLRPSDHSSAMRLLTADMEPTLGEKALATKAK